MRKRRVFIAITPPEDLQERLASFEHKWPQIPCRWIKPNNIHLTIIPPMYLDEDEVVELINALKVEAQTIQPFRISFQKITYGPPGKPSRMIWALGKESKELISLKRKLEEVILEAAIPFRQETRPFQYPHLTLCRMYQEEWRKLEAKPNIDEPLEVEISVESIEIMESELQRGGAKYSILASIPLGASLQSSP